MKVDGRRLARGLALVAWAAFFDWLWLSGEASAYVGPRTTWVVPFGAITLTVVALGYMAGVRRSGPRSRPSLRELAGLAALLAPVLAVLMVPAPRLGAQAVAKKNAPRAASAAANRPIDTDLPVGLFDVAIASESAAYAEERGVRDGMTLELIGLVSRRSDDGSSFDISRFAASCCAADAIPYTVKVELQGGGTFALDDWVQVQGRLQKLPEGEFRLIAGAATVVEPPANPYL